MGAGATRLPPTRGDLLTTAARSLPLTSLRERTANTHRRVETCLNLADPDLHAGQLRAVLVALHAFWAGTEPQVDGWAARHPVEAAELQWPRRRRTDRLARDVAVLGGRIERPAPPAVSHPDTAAVLGWLYVAEGSTLGGAVISRVLARRTPPVRLEAFTPYAEGPGPMWLAYQAWLAGWAGDDPQRTEQVVAAAVTTFSALADRVTPLAAGVAG